MIWYPLKLLWQMLGQNKHFLFLVQTRAQVLKTNNYRNGMTRQDTASQDNSKHDKARLVNERHGDKTTQCKTMHGNEMQNKVRQCNVR